MRLTIRNEQIAVMEAYAQENFARRIAARLTGSFPDAQVTLPDGSEHTVGDLPDERLLELIRSGIAKARSYGMAVESAIAGFVILMFDVSPNFDRHRLSQVLLNDDETEPDKRVDELISVLSDEKWESIRKDYDPAAWEFSPKSEPSEVGPDPVPAAAEKPEAIVESDLDATVRVESKKK